MINRFNLNESEKKRIKSLHGMQVINEQETTVALTDQELKDIVDLGPANRGWEGTNESGLYRSAKIRTNPQQFMWKGSIVYEALQKANWNLDAFINQNDDIVKDMMQSGTHNSGNKRGGKKMSLEDVKRLLELLIENYETKKGEMDRLESFKTGIKSIVDIYESELGIDRNTQRELEGLLSYLTNKEKNGFDNDRWDIRSLKREFPNAVTLLPPSKVMDIFCKLKK